MRKKKKPTFQIYKFQQFLSQKIRISCYETISHQSTYFTSGIIPKDIKMNLINEIEEIKILNQ